jgi:hypothetical protein
MAGGEQTVERKGCGKEVVVAYFKITYRNFLAMIHGKQ